jgi:hypothetical protein
MQYRNVDSANKDSPSLLAASETMPQLDESLRKGSILGTVNKTLAVPQQDIAETRFDRTNREGSDERSHRY